MIEKRKPHIAKLPMTQFPNYEITTSDVAVTIPLFHSPIDSGFTDYDERRIKDVHAKGAIWVALALIYNTDLADAGVGIYFHLEDNIYDITKDIFDAFGVPEQFIRVMTIDDFESNDVGAAQYGKKYMCLEDDLTPQQWVMMDSDAFVCTTGDKFQWYDCFRAFENPSAMNAKTAIYQTKEDYTHWVRMCSYAAGYGFDPKSDLVEQERRALLKLGVPETTLYVGTNLGASPRIQRAYTCTQMLVLPTAHPIIDYIKAHWKSCHWDEGMLNVYQMLHNDISYLPDKLGGLPKHQFESDYINRDISLESQGYLAHLLPDNRVEMTRTDEFFDDFYHALLPSGTDDRNLFGDRREMLPETAKGQAGKKEAKGDPQRPSAALLMSSSDKEREGAHHYGKFYDDLFDVQFLKKGRKLSVLEIGVSAFGGGSLEAWQSLESVEKVVGLDTIEYSGKLGDKASFHQLDGYTPQTIRFLKRTYKPFDIIIDDGSHEIKDQAFFLDHYGELLSESGQLVCEDVDDDAFFRKMCQEEGIYGLDLSANRPEKTADSQHNDRILIKAASDTESVSSPKVFIAAKTREGHRVHILGVPYGRGETIPTCAFDQRVWKSGAMWTDLGYEVVYYGHQDSQVPCTAHVVVTDDAILKKTYGRTDYNFVPPHEVNDHAFTTFAENAEKALRNRAKKDDLVLAFYGQGHRALCERISDLPVHIIEPSIGYPAPFSQNRVYQSVGYMNFIRGQGSHAHRLQQRFPDTFDAINIEPYNVQSENEPRWNDTVIPNFFNVHDFEYNEDREDWMCYIGRIHPCKGLEIIFDLAEATDTHIKVAGPGDIHKIGLRVPKQIEFLGIADREMRKHLLKYAKALLCPSLYLEPFLGIHIEAGFPGCPIIPTDFGAPQEYCIDGVTGFRCMNMDDFMYAVRNIGRIEPAACRQHSLQFTMKRAAISYHEYFHRVLRNAVSGWYSYDPKRQRKDGLRRDMTEDEIHDRYNEIKQKVRAENALQKGGI